MISSGYEMNRLIFLFFRRFDVTQARASIQHLFCICAGNSAVCCKHQSQVKAVRNSQFQKYFSQVRFNRTLSNATGLRYIFIALPIAYTYSNVIFTLGKFIQQTKRCTIGLNFG